MNITVTPLLPEIQCETLKKKIIKVFNEFDSLDNSKQYSINFSGGKDSHALLICYLLWQRERKQKLDVLVLFADTRLEESELYSIVTKLENFIKDKITFKRVKSPFSYWYYQFALGYPVPNALNRWCTGRLKINPMETTKRIPLTGRHYGESAKRDKSLSCSKGECGTDLIKKSYDPIIELRDCDVWDLIFYASGSILYESLFDDLKAVYEGNLLESGSLRMGCVMCPVISMTAITRKNNTHHTNLREILEELRTLQRIKTPRAFSIKPPKNKDELLFGNTTKLLKKDKFNIKTSRYIYSCLLTTIFLKANISYGFSYLKFYPLGAIHVKERKRLWQRIDKEYLIDNNYLSKEELLLIESKLKEESYPKTYSVEWIQKEYRRLDYLNNK